MKKSPFTQYKQQSNSSTSTASEEMNMSFVYWNRREPTTPSPAVSFARQYAQQRGLHKIDFRKILAHRALQRRGFENLLDLLIYQLHHQQLLAVQAAQSDEYTESHYEDNEDNDNNFTPVVNDYCPPEKRGDAILTRGDHEWIIDNAAGESEADLHGMDNVNLMIPSKMVSMGGEMNARGPLSMSAVDGMSEMGQRGFQRSA